MKSVLRIWDSGLGKFRNWIWDPGWEKSASGVPVKYPWSATMLVTISWIFHSAKRGPLECDYPRWWYSCLKEDTSQHPGRTSSPWTTLYRQIFSSSLLEESKNWFFVWLENYFSQIKVSLTDRIKGWKLVSCINLFLRLACICIRIHYLPLYKYFVY